MPAPKLKLDLPLYILITEGGQKVFEKTFTQAPITIGRSLACDIPLAQYQWISRLHFQIVAVDNHYVAVDLNSSYGILVDGRAHSQITLRSGMTLEIGPLRIQVKIGAIAPSPSPPMQGLSMGGLESVPLQENPYPQVSPQASAEPILPPSLRRKPALKMSNSWFKPRSKISFIGSRTALEAVGWGLNAKSPAAYRRTALEVHLTWKGQLYDSQLFFPGDPIRLGTHPEDLYAPTLGTSFAIGRCNGAHSEIYLTKGAKGFVLRMGNRRHDIAQLLLKESLPRRHKHYVLALHTSDRCEIELGHDLKLQIRYVPTPRQLSKLTLKRADHRLRKALFVSSSIHFTFLFLAMWLAPVHDFPKVKNMPARVARLLKPKPVEASPPKAEAPPEPRLAEKTPPPPKHLPEPKRRLPPPKRVVIHSSQKLKVINKLPPARVASERTVSGPKVKALPDLNQIGALAALGALGTPTPNPKSLPVAINVNPNAGGQASMSTSGMIGVLKAKGGRLAGGAMPGVRTAGKGYGTGTGYGVQGLRGNAGSRGIAGAVIGSPKLMTLTKTEGLTHKQVMEVVKQHVAEIQQCYERSLLNQPQLSGRVEYEWAISPRGAVGWVKVKRSDVADGDQLNNCVSGVFRKMRFPIASNGESTTPTIGFPFGRL